MKTLDAVFRSRFFSLLPAFIAVSASFTAAAAFAGEPPRTASVLYFDNTSGSGDFDWLRKGFADMLAGDLSAGGAVRLVEREELERILREQEFALSGFADPSTAPEVGKLLNARLIVYGAFLVAGGTSDPTIRVDAKAVDSESGAVEASASAEGPASDALALERLLSSRLAASLGVPVAPRADAPASLESARAYYRGVDLLDAGDYASALSFFQESTRLDPTFLKPGVGIESAYRFLKDFKKQRFRREMNAMTADIRDLIARLGAAEFYSFGAAVMNPAKFGFSDAAAVSEAYRARPAVFAGDTPVQAIWNLQNNFLSLGQSAAENFGDEILKGRCDDEILRWAAVAEKSYPDDPFLPEVRYNRLFVYRDRTDWLAVKALCERLMADYPDYRMMWAVEDFYEDSLENMKE